MYIWKMSRTPSTEIKELISIYHAHRVSFAGLTPRPADAELCETFLAQLCLRIDGLKKTHADDTKEMYVEGVADPANVFSDRFLDELCLIKRYAFIVGEVIDTAH